MFEAIESFIVQGTPDTREVAIIGILEGLQNVAAGRWYGQKVFVKYLRPESKVAWDELNASWGYAKTSLGSRVYLFYQKMAHKMAGRKGRKRPEL